MELVFATNNENKLAEIRSMVGNVATIRSLADIGCEEELPETQETLEGNALQKAQYVATNYGVDCFADDTGLEVAALNGEPGVYSARYAGPQRDTADNMAKVLSGLEGKTDRSARFRTAIALIRNGEEHTFEGEVRGHITESMSGQEGFGYDPIFVPQGEARTMAEMSMDEKNAISHRGNAFRALSSFLSTG